MAFESVCDICRDPRAEYDSSSPFPRRRCPRCGDFDFDLSLGWAKIESLDHMVRLSAWVRDQNVAGVVPVRITPEISHRITQMPLPKLRERADLALCVIARKYPDLENPTPLLGMAADKELLALTYSAATVDASTLISILLEDGYLRGLLEPSVGKAKSGVLTPKGLLAADTLRASTSSSYQGFVAMSFDGRLNDAWTNGFDPGIRMAGFLPFRIDNKNFVGGITDEIMAEIRHSRFVVADYTHQKNGVYFEAGFALGLGLTVIRTCLNDEVGQLHFDIKHLNTLLWEKLPRSWLWL